MVIKIRRFKVGDKVKITKDLNTDNYKDVVGQMINYAGKEAKIIGIKDEIDPINFSLDVDNGRFCWYPDALSFINQEEI